ncbi:exosome-associated family protein [Niveomyces insectorum RCEF 264]|uniref:Exosome complex protein n=1 Tax=Niveomyces insectorum RCEF 264 TaxID=1081102 RepID=A0A167URK4_9HYPO|nr:exosome-associated family protein [Niveomyces insectorum RCEF 264]
MDDIQPRLDQLTAALDGLEAAMTPLLLDGKTGKTGKTTASKAVSNSSNSLATASLRLPLLDKARLHVLASYALESTLFCSLGLAGVDVRQHAVYRELLRVRQYMTKIDGVAKPVTAPTSRLDKAAAIRFVKADLDDPQVKAQLDALVKEAAAAATAEDDDAAAAGKESSSAAHRSHRKRGGGPAGAAPADRNKLTKRPKHGAETAGGSGSGSHKRHASSRGSRPA